MSQTKEQNREFYFDKFIGKYFDTLWNSDSYLDNVSKGIDLFYGARKEWNKNIEAVLSFFQLPNQQMQQKTLHILNMMLSEWRFEQEELKIRLDKIEKDIAELKGNFK